MCPALWVFCMERQPTTLGLQDELDTASNDIQSTGEKRSSWTFWDILNYFELFWIILNTSELHSISLAWELVRSNPAREWSVTQAWADRCLDEFFAQGDQDRRRVPNTSLIIFAHHLHNPSQSFTIIWSLHTNLFHSLFILYQSLSCYIYLNLRISQIFPVVSSWCRCHLMSNYISWRRKLRVFLFNSWTIGRGALDMCKFWYRRHRRPLWRCFDSTTEINGDLLCNHYDLWKFSELHMVLVAACSCGSSLKRQGRGLLRNLC